MGLIRHVNEIALRQLTVLNVALPPYLLLLSPQRVVQWERHIPPPQHLYFDHSQYDEFEYAKANQRLPMSVFQHYPKAAIVKIIYYA